MKLSMIPKTVQGLLILTNAYLKDPHAEFVAAAKSARMKEVISWLMLSSSII